MAFVQASEFELVAEGLGYPESPKYLPDGSILLVDIKNECLSRINPDGSQEVVAQLNGGPNGLALGPDGKAWIANNGGFNWEVLSLPNGQSINFGTTQPDDYKGGWIESVDMATGQAKTQYHSCSKGLNMAGFGQRKPELYDLPETIGLRGPDDLVFDKQGGLWISDWGKQRPREVDVTGIYYANSEGSDICEAFFPLQFPNGIALSPAEDRLYTALTFSRKVIFWELDGPGKIKPNPATMDGSHLLTAKLPGQANLDSMTVDEDGNVYVSIMLPDGIAAMSNGGIAVISPDGKSVDFMEINIEGRYAPMPSALCFGGSDRKTMYVTCGAAGLLLKCQVHVPGHPLNFNPY